jgi:serine/threonine protein kinase
MTERGHFSAGPRVVRALVCPRFPRCPLRAKGRAARLGDYKLLQKIGEGGFGVVYMAEQREPVKRRVALKIIKLGMDTRQVVGRFEAERQALALMDHPNIARVLDGGSTETGRPFFVMELVRGVPITQFCDDQKLGTRARLSCSSMCASPCITPTRRGSSIATSNRRTCWSPCTTTGRW